MKRKTTTKLPKKVSPAVLTTMDMPMTETPIKRALSKKAIFITALIILFGLGLIYSKPFRSLFVVGKVNNQFVTRWQLEKSLNDRYAKTVFDDISSTILLRQLAQKNDITISSEELKQEIAATEERLGGEEALQSTLERLGYTQSRFEDEMKTQVLVRKLAEKLFKIEVTDEEVDKFFADNKTLFPDKKLEEVKKDIGENLKEQKLQQQFSSWFTEEKTKAVVVSYL